MTGVFLKLILTGDMGLKIVNDMRQGHLRLSKGDRAILLVKPHTHRPILRGFIADSAVESADSIPESADSTTDFTNFTIVGRLSISNMFVILNPLESADDSRLTIAVGRREIGPVGTGLYSDIGASFL